MGDCHKQIKLNLLIEKKKFFYIKEKKVCENVKSKKTRENWVARLSRIRVEKSERSRIKLKVLDTEKKRHRDMKWGEDVVDDVEK